jgi:hypothetical protein
MPEMQILKHRKIHVFLQGCETCPSVTPEHRNIVQREIFGAKRKRHETGKNGVMMTSLPVSYH